MKQQILENLEGKVIEVITKTHGKNIRNLLDEHNIYRCGWHINYNKEDNDSNRFYGWKDRLFQNFLESEVWIDEDIKIITYTELKNILENKNNTKPENMKPEQYLKMQTIKDRLKGKMVECITEEDAEVVFNLFQKVDPSLVEDVENPFWMSWKDEGLTYYFWGLNSRGKFDNYTKRTVKRNPNYSFISIQELKNIIEGEGREIIGYKTDRDYYGGKVPKNTIIKHQPCGDDVDDETEWGVLNEDGENSFYFPIEIVQNWEPVYKEEKLPKICGYEGKISQDSKLVVYGCKTFSFERVKTIYDLMKSTGMNQLHFENDEQVSFNEVKQIVDIINKI